MQDESQYKHRGEQLRELCAIVQRSQAINQAIQTAQQQAGTPGQTAPPPQPNQPQQKDGPQ